MPDSALENLTATTSVASADLFYVVVDPSGTPLSRKLTLANLVSSVQAVGTFLPLAGGTMTGNLILPAVLADPAASGPQFTSVGNTGYGMRVVADRVDFWAAGGVTAVLNGGGLAMNGIPVIAQTFKGTDASGANAVASDLTVEPGVSTGNATPAKVVIQSTVAGSSGSTAQTLSNTLTVTNGMVQVASGSLTATAINFGVANTGILDPSGQGISFAVAGSELFRVSSGSILYLFANDTVVYGHLVLGAGSDATIVRSQANGILFGGSNVSLTAGSATTRNCVNKAVTSIANNTATTVFTVTIPNAAHSASIRVRLVGSSGAGGNIGANESTQEAEYLVNLTRTAGVNAVAAIGAAIGQPAAATVAGGNAVAVTATLSAISGAVGADNTFDIKVTIARAAGTATNHTCLAFAELLNANASGVTIA